MAAFEHLLQAYDVGDLLDELASADPPAYLRRCFAEGISSPVLSWPRVQQLGLCAMVLDAIVHDRDYKEFEPELIADWRAHHGSECARIQDTAAAALRRAAADWRAAAPDAAVELEELEHRLTPG